MPTRWWGRVVGIVMAGGGLTTSATAQMYQESPGAARLVIPYEEPLVSVTIIPGGSARPGAWVGGPLAQTMWVTPEVAAEMKNVESLGTEPTLPEPEIETQSLNRAAVEAETIQGSP